MGADVHESLLTDTACFQRLGKGAKGRVGANLNDN